VNKLSGNTKSYLKEYSKTESEVVQPLEEKSKDLALLVIHWKNCLENSKRIFKDLKGYLKMNAIWFAAFRKIKKNKRSGTAGSGWNIKDLNLEKILKIKKQVLQNKYNWKKCSKNRNTRQKP